jgi:hypothetical protein
LIVDVPQSSPSGPSSRFKVVGETPARTANVAWDHRSKALAAFTWRVVIGWVLIGDFQSTPQRFQAASRVFAVIPTDSPDASLAAGRQYYQKLSSLTIDCSAAIAVAEALGRPDWKMLQFAPAGDVGGVAKTIWIDRRTYRSLRC